MSRQSQNGKPSMGLSDIAQTFRVSRETVRNAIKSGDLHGTVTGEGKRSVYSIEVSVARRWAIEFHEREIVERRRLVRESAAALRDLQHSIG